MLTSRTLSALLAATALATLAPAYAEAPTRASALDQQQHRPVWVFFRDRALHDDNARRAALDQARHDLHPRARWRRLMRRTAPGLVDEHDLPVPQPYIDAVRAAGARIRTQSRWLNAVSIEASPDRLAEIRRLPFVQRLQPVARLTRAPWPRTGARSGPQRLGDFYGRTRGQLDLINIPAVHDRGFTGAGVIIGVLDTGFLRIHEVFNYPGHPINVLGEHDFINDDDNTGIDNGDDPDQHAHGTMVLATIAGYLPGEYVGGAYDAAFYLAKTEDITREEPIEEDFYVAGLEWLEANGVDVATSSLLYSDWYSQDDLDGRTAPTSIAVNIATINGVVCCTAVGNAGHDQNPDTSHTGAPADAFLVLSAGSVNLFGEISGFSSDGPTADGRPKPEVLAMGEGTATIWPYDDTGYTEASGTSLSTPLVAAAAALIVQAHPDWTVPHIRQALFETASIFRQTGTYDPLYVQGYGIIDTLAAIDFIHQPRNGDIDDDGDIDIADFATLAACFSGSANPVGGDCEYADLDRDGDVDIADFATLAANFTGSQ